MTVELKDVPASPSELEHYVAALFQAAGYFVDKNLERLSHGSGGDQILELDVVASDYHVAQTMRTIVEAKSGKWGYADAFKVLGWLTYLELDNGMVIHQGGIAKDEGLLSLQLQSHGLTTLDLADCTNAVDRFNSAQSRPINDPTLVELWRYSYWAEKVIDQNLRRIAKSDARKGSEATVQYARLINDETFFEADPLQRAKAIYESYRNHPKLSASVAAEIGTGHYKPDAPQSTAYTDAMYSGKHPTVQAAMWLEHRARLALLKASVDVVDAVGTAGLSPVTPDGKLRVLPDLPESFWRGILEIEKEPYFRLYPVFWQIFLGSWGGFVLLDRKDAEYAQLSKETGVPVDHIESALGAFNKLFPPVQWLVSPPDRTWRGIMLMPPAMRGIGSLRRQVLYQANSYDELGYSDKTATDLASWHNALYRLLSNDSLAGT